MKGANQRLLIPWIRFKNAAKFGGRRGFSSRRLSRTEHSAESWRKKRWIKRGLRFVCAEQRTAFCGDLGNFIAIFKRIFLGFWSEEGSWLMACSCSLSHCKVILVRQPRLSRLANFSVFLEERSSM